MGTNKAFLPVGGVKVVDRILAAFTGMVAQIVIVSNDVDLFADYAGVAGSGDTGKPVADGGDIGKPLAGACGTGMSVLVTADDMEFRGMGPLAGIYSGLQLSKYAHNLVVSCDLPFPSSALAAFLLGKLEDDHVDAVVPIAGGRLHPLFAAYHRDCAGVAGKLLRNKRQRMTDLFQQIRAAHVEQEKWSHLADPAIALFNMNTPQDWELANRIAAAD